MPYVWIPDKIEYEPLFDAELRPFTMAQLRVLCVDGFPLSTVRDLIMSCLEHVVCMLEEVKIEGKLWVDGSFLTKKIDPEDVDLVLYLRSEFVDSSSPEQQETLSWFAHCPHVKKYLNCHCYPLIAYPEANPAHWYGVYDHAYWLRQWGFSRGDPATGAGMVRKGIAVVELGQVTK